MNVLQIADIDSLQPYRERWDELAGDCVFRSWTWLTTWWKHYGAEQELFVLLVLDTASASSCRDEPTCATTQTDKLLSANPENVIAILPCYLQNHMARGRVLRMLGDGEICSDYLDVLCRPEDSDVACEAVARFLWEHSEHWELIDFSAVPATSLGLHRLAQELVDRDCHLSLRENENCWSVELPPDWEAFLALQSKSHRKQLRRLEKRVLGESQTVWHPVATLDELKAAWPILIDLHQRRRNSLKEPGCFASPRWAAFHEEVSEQLLAEGKLRVSWLELSGQPVAAEYHFAGQQTTWAYQGGVDPDRIAEEPGRLSTILTIKQAIEAGHQHFDFLRGDEPYKAHWRATPQQTFDLQIVPARGSAKLRWQAYHYLQRAAQTARQLTSMLG